MDEEAFAALEDRVYDLEDEADDLALYCARLERALRIVMANPANPYTGAAEALEVLNDRG